jgi:metacaspase-1
MGFAAASNNTNGLHPLNIPISNTPSMPQTIKILFIHGIGFQEADVRWQAQWKQAAETGIQKTSPNTTVQAEFLEYDQMFKDNDAPNVAMVTAVGSMLATWAAGKVGGLFGRSRGGLAGLKNSLDAYPGMVAEWAGDKSLRKALRGALQAKVTAMKPHVVAAHSLGALLSYDWMHEDASPATLSDLTYLTFGAQISNPALVPIFGGQVRMPAGLEQWMNLWNEQDKVFVDSIRLNADGYAQIAMDEPFKHDGVGYLSHAETQPAWDQIALTYAPPTSLSRALLRGANAFADTGARSNKVGALLHNKQRATKIKKHKALLVGINEYANPADNLEGCVNDVFQVSAVLQECGFNPEDIRVVLNDRATTKGIKDRLEWLLEDAKGDDERFFYFSGHGAQMPSYGGDEIPEEVDECLVPYDFAWSADTAVVDDWFYELYANLAYSVRFVAALDCCHSGGMAREGGGKARGLNPPDDVRHRAIRWDREIEMWVPRVRFEDTRGLNARTASNLVANARVKTTRSLGSGKVGRENLSKAGKSKGEAYGPYQPVILKACKKDELAREYRHAAESYGAFTYCMSRLLRKGAGELSFKALVKETDKLLRTIGYTQHGETEGPTSRINECVPWIPLPSKKKK